MRVLLTGATGFLGRYILAGLVAAGHDVVPAVRDPKAADRLLPAPRAIRVDFNRDTAAEAWLPRLEGIDAVINCAGILHGTANQSITAIHDTSPKALFAACEQAGVKRVVQISAISAEPGAGTAYASTKMAADQYLARSNLDWIVLRPSLVYAEGAYGGTALFRALAALPFFIPVVGSGEQAFQPIHIDDLVATILHVLATPSLSRRVIDPVGPELLTFAQMLSDLRRWLGFAPAPILKVPPAMARIAVFFSALFFGGPINRTALRQLEFGNAGPAGPFTAATGIVPRRWKDALLAHPAQAQDRWHARLYLLRPLLRLAIGLTWIASGAVGFFYPPAIEAHFTLLGFAVPRVAFQVACVIDFGVGVAVMNPPPSRWLTLLQLALVALYTVVLTFVQPSLWLEPFGPLLKNIPFAIAILTLAAIEPER